MRTSKDAFENFIPLIRHMQVISYNRQSLPSVFQNRSDSIEELCSESGCLDGIFEQGH